MVLYGVKARAYAAADMPALCRSNLLHAAQAHADTNPHPSSWQETLCNPAHLAAATGHALAALHHHTNDPTDLENARQHLTTAATTFNPNTHARAIALCHARLANLHLHTGDPDRGEQSARRAITALTAVDSARLRRALTTVRDTATAHGTTPDLVADIDTAITNAGYLPPTDTTGEALPN